MDFSAKEAVGKRVDHPVRLHPAEAVHLQVVQAVAIDAGNNQSWKCFKQMLLKKTSKYAI